MPSSPPAPAGSPLQAADWRAVAAGALLWTWLVTALRPSVFEGLDFVRISGPYLQFLGDNLRHGVLPWWNPYASLGRPFLADLQTASFYPPMWLTVVFGLRAGCVIITALHAGLALAGFIRLVRPWVAARPVAWAGALVYLFSAPLLARMQAGQLNYVYALCYLPLVLDLAARFALQPTRRRWAGLAVTWAALLLCCHPQVFWLSAIGAGLFVSGLLWAPPWPAALRAWLRAGAGLLLACGAGMALLGFVLVPFLGLVGQSNRAVPSLAFSGAFAMNLDQGISLLTTASGVLAVNWEYNLHFAVAAGLGGLAAFGRWREPVIRGALLLVALGAVLMVGEATPVFAVLYKILPGLASFRVPARAGVLVVLGLVTAATVFAGAVPARAGGRRPVVLAALLVAAGVTAYFSLHLARLPGAPLWWGQQLLWLLAAVTAWWWWFGPEAAPARRGLLPIVLAGQIGLLVWSLKRLPGYPVEFPVEQVVAAASRAHRLAAAGVPVRVNLPPDVIRDNSGMLHRYATLTGFESLSLRRVWVYLHRAVGANPDHAYNTTPDGHIYDGGDKLAATNLTVTLPAEASVLQINPAPAPRAWLVNRFTLVPDANAAIARMTAGHPIRRDALVEAPFAAGLGVAPADESGTARITAFDLNALRIEVDSPAAALLVVAEAWYPGWRATAGGRELPCIPVNDWMRGIPVPAGRSTVQLSYHQPGLFPGILLTLAAAVGLAAVWGRPDRRAG